MDGDARRDIHTASTPTPWLALDMEAGLGLGALGLGFGASGLGIRT